MCHTCSWNDDCEFPCIDDFPDQSQVTNQRQVVDHQIGWVTRQSPTADASDTLKLFNLNQIIINIKLISRSHLGAEFNNFNNFYIFFLEMIPNKILFTFFLKMQLFLDVIIQIKLDLTLIFISLQVSLPLVGAKAEPCFASSDAFLDSVCSHLIQR